MAAPSKTWRDPNSIPCYGGAMGKLEQIENAIEQLSPEETARLRDFFDALEERRFDEAIERGAKSGKLDSLMTEAKAEIDAGIGEDL